MQRSAVLCSASTLIPFHRTQNHNVARTAMITTAQPSQMPGSAQLGSVIFPARSLRVVHALCASHRRRRSRRRRRKCRRTQDQKQGLSTLFSHQIAVNATQCQTPRPCRACPRVRVTTKLYARELRLAGDVTNACRPTCLQHCHYYPANPCYRMTDSDVVRRSD